MTGLFRFTLPMFGLLAFALLGSGCATLSDAQRDHAAAIAAQARSQVVDCSAADACAEPSPLRDLGARAAAESTPQAPHHYALILDQGGDALLARINLIRSARRAIDLQTYIFDHDDSGRLVLDELLAAARRGVRVRVLIDQLSAIGDPQLVAALAGAHENFALRIYNPTFGKVKLNYLDYAASVLCCFRRFNQRMHTKLLVVDDAVGITGGRNYQDDYYDWDAEFDFRDRDVLVAGPVALAMADSFEAFWNADRSIPAERLNDVGRTLLRDGVPALPAADFLHPERVEEMRAAAADAGIVEERLVAPALPVGAVDYIADLPQKHRRRDRDEEARSASELETLIAGAQHEVLLQTPYLIMSDRAREVFGELHRRASPPRVTVSTNSLASTDNPIVYAVSHKYKRRYLRELGFHIHELKPFPEDAPIDYAGLMAAIEDEHVPHADPGLILGSGSGSGVDAANRVDRPLRRAESRPSFLSSGSSTRPLPLKRAGLRIGLHAKSMVIDDRIAVIGTHNFDPRSDRYNTESVVIIDDAAFAARLAGSIERDIAPANSWTIAPRQRLPLVSGLNYSLDKISSALPVFDLWPWRYATSYEFVPGPDCPRPLPSNDPKFLHCYKSVGDFPEVSVGPKSLFARILMAFGAGLVPIL
ncbi:phospholipase D family protein [Pseudoxanthomonas sangjuensis]|uniref:phospholipase D family protein n=1 Tax=Pseudoxanthomonas sangjuensis TaxID=1503750 RepID=UPI001FEBFF4F|nr:phospholipase D family protein [Pseudoxanthomonas sangjuensis]